jgi:type III pantothenate kinase
MKSICIDIGNTLIKFSAFFGNEMVHFELVEKSKISRIIGFIKDRKIEYGILSSVAEVPEDVLTFLKVHLKMFINLDHKTLIPVENFYDTKETLGKDRLAAIIGANFLYPGENSLVIDAGSAITYDLINSKGQFLGGNISPGIQMRYKALHTFTKRLPLIELSTEIPLFGKNTTDAIRVGVQMGVIYEIDGTIDKYKELYPDLKVILTGGDNKYFDNKLKNSIFVVPNLVLIGLNRILAFNV